MSWLKRNWMLLLGVLIALGALAGSVVFLIAQIKTEATYDSQAKGYIETYKQAVQAAVFPNDSNIQIAQFGAQQYKKYATDARVFLTVPPLEKVNTIGFKSLLENTVAELQGAATASGITVPARYAFSFEAIRPMVNLPTNALDQLTVQVHEVKELANILIQSKVHQIDSIRRIRVIADEGAGRPDYLDGLTMLATAQVTITPYEITFRGLSTELSAVLDALQRSRTYYVVKKVTIENMGSVEMGTISTTNAPTAVATNAAPGVTTPPPPKQPPAGGKQPPKPAGPITILDEKPFRTTIFMEVVKAK